jgi:hypothetical protein
VQPDGVLSTAMPAHHPAKSEKPKIPSCDHPANPTGWSFFDRNFLLKRFRKHEKRFRKKSRKPLKTQE